MKRTIYKTLLIALSVFSLSLAYTPLVVSAAGPANKFEGRIVPECKRTVNGRTINACGYQDLIKLGINIMNFAIYLMAILAVISFVYAGFLYMSSAGNQSQISKAHGIFTKVALGIFFTLGAWLIVHQIAVWLGVKEGFTLLQ